MDEYTKNYYDAFVYAPPIFSGAIQYEYLSNSSRIPGYKNFKNQPIHIIPDVLENEIFLPITHSELVPNVMIGRYYISNYGRLYDACRCQYIIPYQDTRGYYTVHLAIVTNNYIADSIDIRIHRLVNFYFNYNNLAIRNEYVTNHKDLDVTNNNVTNLEWITQKENVYHYIIEEQKKFINAAEDDDIKMKIRTNRHAKITPEMANKICDLLQQGYSMSVISQALNIHKSTITDIKYRRRWAWISEGYDFSNCVDARSGQCIEENKLHKICKMIAENQDIETISNETGIDRCIISGIKYNGLYPEIRKIYGIHHYSDQE